MAAEEIKASGLRVIGIEGELSTEAGEVAPNHLLQILQTSVDRGEASVPFPLSNKREKQ